MEGARLNFVVNS